MSFPDLGSPKASSASPCTSPGKAHLRVPMGHLTSKTVLQQNRFLISTNFISPSLLKLAFSLLLKRQPWIHQFHHLHSRAPSHATEFHGSAENYIIKLYHLQLEKQKFLEKPDVKDRILWPFWTLFFFRLQIVIHVKIIVFSGLRCRIQRRECEHFGQINEYIPLVSN